MEPIQFFFANYPNILLGAFACLMGVNQITQIIKNRKADTKKEKLSDKQDELSTNHLLQEQINALKEQVKIQTTEMNKMAAQINALQISIDERDRKFAAAILALQGKDPEMQAMMSSIKEYMSFGKPVLENIVRKYDPIMEKLDKHLDAQKVVGTVLAQK